MAARILTIREHLLAAGVKNLREFGYPNCTAKNILTDAIYRTFFASMLRDNKGQSAAADPEIDKLLAELAALDRSQEADRPKR